jgi:hypothetical protein
MITQAAFLFNNPNYCIYIIFSEIVRGENSKKLPFRESFSLERVRGIEPLSLPWQGRVLPLNHTRTIYKWYFSKTGKIFKALWCRESESN